MEHQSQTNEERIARKRKHIPDNYLKLFDRVMSGKACASQCLKLQCLECYAYERAETAKCDTITCALYHKNPYRLSKSRRDSKEPANNAL